MVYQKHGYSVTCLTRLTHIPATWVQTGDTRFRALTRCYVVHVILIKGVPYTMYMSGDMRPIRCVVCKSTHVILEVGDYQCQEPSCYATWPEDEI